MTEQMRSIRENLNAPSELVDAVAGGEPYRRSAQRGDSKRRHVKRFSVAIAAYACTALLVVGAVMLLPKIIEKMPANSHPDLTTPPPVSAQRDTTTRGGSDTLPPETVTSPETLLSALLTADEVVITSKRTVESDLLDVGYDHTYTLDGSLAMYELHEIDLVEYSDFANQKAYSKLGDADWVVTDTYGTSREDVVTGIFGEVPFAVEDDNYTQADGKFRFTEEAVDRMQGEYESYVEMVVFAVGEAFETEITFEPTDEGGVWSIRHWTDAGSMSTVIDVRFTDTNVRLPDEVADAKPLEDEHKNFTPDLLHETFDSGSDVTISAERQLYKNGKITEQTTVYERDGDKVRMTERADLGESVRYLDMANGLEYYAEEGGWLAKGTDYNYWNGVMWEYIFGIEPTFLFDSDNYFYNVYSYELTDEASEALSATLSQYAAVNDTFGGSVSVSIMIAHYGVDTTEYWEITTNTTSRDGTVNEFVVYTITFGDTSVDLPGKEPDGSEDSEGETDELLPPSLFRGMLYGEYGDTDNMTVTADVTSGSWYLKSVYEREGDKIKETSTSASGETVSYHSDEWARVVDMYVLGNYRELFSVFGGYFEVMFVDGNFTLEDGRYVATEAFKKQCHETGKADCAAGDEYFVEWYGESPTYEIFFDYEEGVHRFCYRFYTTDGELTDEIILTITFDTTVDLPA